MTRSDRPDIIFFMVDQLSARWLEFGLCGDIVDLPNLSALAADGVRFRRTISSNPLCCPARATLATGLTSQQHGVLQNGYFLDPQIQTFMRSLRESGYQTGGAGKFHFRPHYESLFPDYREYGFDACWVTEDARGGPWLDWILAEYPEHADAVLSTVWARQIEEFGRYGPDGTDLAARMAAIPPQGGAYELPFPAHLSQSEWITARACQLMADASSDQPLYLHISYVQPHSPFAPPQGYLDRVNSDSIPEPLAAEWRGDSGAPRCLEALATATSGRDWLQDRRHYFADLVHLDEQLGKVQAAVRERGRSDRTYLVFLSDHGEMLGDHGLMSKGEMHYDACVRVPLLIAGPEVLPGRQLDEFVQLEDIFPTVFEMADLELPNPRSMRLQLPFAALPGRSLMPLSRGESPENWRGSAYVESYNNIDSNSLDRWARSVINRDWRYTWYPDDGGEQLFNLRADPGEQDNLAGAAEYRQVRNRMRDELLQQVVRGPIPLPRVRALPTASTD